jgi:para-nitrobenzyl esterase
MVQGKVSEDCLTLNIWTPAHDDGRRPVLVWIHGGGFNEGSASVPIYRGASLAGRDIVVVTINYRLGLFGFLAHPELTAEAGTGIPSNFGLQDQIAALRWVQQNIATFGGDPAQVTIAGQSAGSISVHSLVASPLTQGLFVRAIAESGLPNLIPIQSLAEAERNGELFAHDKGAVSLAKLRSMSAAELVSPAGASMGAKYQFGLVVDGKLLPQSPIDLMKQGRSHDIPMLIGQNADEGSAFPGYGAGDKPAFQAFMARSFEGEAATFSRFYAGENDTERSQAVKSASRDRGLASMDQWLLLRSKAGKTPVWAYYYSHAEPGPDSAKFGAFHSSEIPYVLSTLDMAPGRNFSFTDRLLNLTMSSYWINFIKSGDPNGDRLMSWPAINADSPRLMEFGDVVAIRPLLEADKLKAYRGYAIKGGAFSMF